MRRTEFRLLLVAGAVAVGTAAALAPFSPACAGGPEPRTKSAHRHTGPQLAVPGTSGSSLSHQLSRSGGVLHPPPLGENSTPVIPPPGTPGGNPNVEPK